MANQLASLAEKPVATERVAALVIRAAEKLAKAKTSAEVLDAMCSAKNASDAAQNAARLHKAHREVVEACCKLKGDAIIIEHAAQCRLADEYDKAVEQDEVQKRGGDRKSKIKVENAHLDPPSLKEMGLDKEIMRQARKARESSPEAVRKAVEEKLQAGEEPTRANVRRAMKDETSPEIKKARKGDKGRLKHHPRRDEIIELFDQAWADQKIADKLGMSRRIVSDVVEREKNERYAKADGKAEATAEVAADPEVLFDALSMSAQEKMKAWQRQTEKRLRQQIEEEERAKIQTMWDRTVLPHYNKRLAEADRVIKTRRGVWSRNFYRKLLACVHPDRSSSSDAPEVFRAVKDSELLLCKEAEAPTTSVGIPKTVEELMARRQGNGAANRG